VLAASSTRSSLDLECIAGLLIFDPLSHPYYFFTHPLEQKLVVLDPKSRISAKTALYHRYFDDLDKQQFRQ